MVKVVGQDSAVSKRITCKNCGAINEYLPADVRELYRGRDISGCGEGRDGFNCGQCGKEVTTRSF
jgi:DNA-directed RNA polymerase subunit RPC12/RpoP